MDYLIKGQSPLGRVPPKDIGIVTPFVLQSKMIKKKLRENNLKDITVGTVELFQGQEKEIMIMTTVRSKTFVHEGREHIGFLSNPKRFNVALTRAKSTFIVVGNPYVLEQNYMWRYLLEFCIENGSYHGTPYSLKSSGYKQDLSEKITMVNSKTLFPEDPFQLFMLSNFIFRFSYLC